MEGIVIDKLALGLSIAMIDQSYDYVTYVVNELGLPEDSVKLIPQGVGGKYCYDRYGLNLEGAKSVDVRKSNSYLIVDIGFNTLDVIKVFDGKMTSDSVEGFKSKGAILITDEIIKSAESKKIYIGVTEAKEILENKLLDYRGQVIDFKLEVGTIVKNYFISTIKLIEEKFGTSINKVENIIFIGGTSALLKSSLEQFEEVNEIFRLFYHGNFALIPNRAEFYNVVGYLVKLNN
jgi:hypothetical protein